MWKASAHKYYQILSHDIKKQKWEYILHFCPTVHVYILENDDIQSLFDSMTRLT